MRLYHYTTWRGKEILPLGVLIPSNAYLMGNGPKLVWLTENEYWEPCIQACTIKGTYVKGASSPEVYHGTLAIPCWKFEVEVKNLYKLHYPVAGWTDMLEDGKSLGSDISQWHWSTNKVEIINSYKWGQNKWVKV